MQINIMQKLVLLIGMILIITMTLFPPWTYTFKYKTAYSEKPAGYSFINSPPPPKSTRAIDGVKIDIVRLSVQAFAVIIVMGIGFVIFSGKKQLNK